MYMYVLGKQDSITTPFLKVDYPLSEVASAVKGLDSHVRTVEDVANQSQAPKGKDVRQSTGQTDLR